VVEAVTIQITDLTVCGAPTHAGRLCLNSGRKANPFLQRLTGVFPKGVNLILGPNGAGKSLLVRTLAGLTRLESGTVMIDGRVADPSLLRQNSGYLPQTFNFYPQYSARELLRYLALLKGMDNRVMVEEQVEKVLRRTTLAAAAERKIGDYSLGMRRQVGIAQALLGEPTVLLLDDPTAGLAPEVCDNFRLMMAELGRERTVIWASSMLIDACCADRILILDRGQCRFWGTPAQLRDDAVTYGATSFTDCDGLITAAESWSGLLERGYQLRTAQRHDFGGKKTDELGI
jgi:ABC-2 type transport system ATP-binding protein